MLAKVMGDGAAFHAGDRRSPARTLIEHGAAVAIATGHDSVLSPTLSLPAVLAIACTELRMTPAEAIVAATVNAAHALGRGTRCGSLEYNKNADILLLNAGDYPSKGGTVAVADIPNVLGWKLEAFQ